MTDKPVLYTKRDAHGFVFFGFLLGVAVCGFYFLLAGAGTLMATGVAYVWRTFVG